MGGPISLKAIFCSFFKIEQSASLKIKRGCEKAIAAFSSVLLIKSSSEARQTNSEMEWIPRESKRLSSYYELTKQNVEDAAQPRFFSVIY